MSCGLWRKSTKQFIDDLSKTEGRGKENQKGPLYSLFRFGKLNTSRIQTSRLLMEVGL